MILLLLLSLLFACKQITMSYADNDFGFDDEGSGTNSQTAVDLSSQSYIDSQDELLKTVNTVTFPVSISFVISKVRIHAIVRRSKTFCSWSILILQ